jgi:hypothetical protein
MAQLHFSHSSFGGRSQIHPVHVSPWAGGLNSSSLAVRVVHAIRCSSVPFFLWIIVWIIAGRSRYSSWVTRPKDLRFCGSNRSPAVISRTRPPGVWWNAWEDIKCSLIRFLSSISHVVLLALFRVSAVIPNPVPRADSLSIARRSWPS